jgi:hypothetical protein
MAGDDERASAMPEKKTRTMKTDFDGDINSKNAGTLHWGPPAKLGAG